MNLRGDGGMGWVGWALIAMFIGLTVIAKFAST